MTRRSACALPRRAPLRHVLSLAGRAAAAAGPGPDVLLRPDRVRPGARRQRAAVPRRDVVALVASRDRLRGDPRPQHHRHQRQDLRRRARRERRARGEGDRLVPGGHRRPRAGATRPPAEGDRVGAADRAVHRGADRDRPRVPGRRRRLLPRGELPRLRAPLGPAPGPGRGAGAEPAQGGRPRLRALEGEQARHRGHVVGVAVGPRPAGLAHRVLRDGRGAARARRSRSTAAASTSSSRTTRTRWRSRARSGIRSHRSGRTTACSGSPARRCRSRSATSRRCARRSTSGGARHCSSSSSPATGASRSTSPTRRWRRPPRAETLRNAFTQPAATAPRPTGRSSGRRSRTTSTRPRRSRCCTSWASAGRLELLRRGLAVFGLESLAERDAAPPRLLGSPNGAQQARAERDFATADRLRDELAAAGWEMRDEPAAASRSCAVRDAATSSTAGARCARRCGAGARCSRSWRPNARSRPSRGSPRRGRSSSVERELTERAGTRDHQGVRRAGGAVPLRGRLRARAQPSGRCSLSSTG